MLSEHLAILHGYPIGYLILALWTLYCMLRYTRVLVGIHGVRSPWSSSVSQIDQFVSMASITLLLVVVALVTRPTTLPSPVTSTVRQYPCPRGPLRGSIN